MGGEIPPSRLLPMKNIFARGHLFALLGSMYLCKPTREALANWRQLLDQDPLEGAKELQQALAAIDLDSEQEIDDLLWEYTRLFIGPGHLPCPPWESVYTSPKRLMMQEAYVEVREFYFRVGIEVGSEDVMPDHIGAELNFASFLIERIAKEPEMQAQYGALAEEFLTSHLRNWAPRFAANMEEASESPYYSSLAKTLRETIT